MKATPPGEQPGKTPPKTPRKGQWKPGQSGNPSGRPKGVKNYNPELWKSIAKFRVSYQLKGAKRKGPKISWIHAMLLRALESDTVMVELIRRMWATPVDPKANAGEAPSSGGNTLVQLLLQDPAVRTRIAALDESIGASLSKPGGNGDRGE